MGILNASPTRVFRRKPVDEVGPEDLQEGGGLQHVLGLWQLTAIGIGGIIGAGIFSLAGAVAKDSAGPLRPGLPGADRDGALQRTRLGVGVRAGFR